ncbi:MAG: hypothetical protein ACYTG2_10755 [Planctomycetota bacterium]
MARTAGARSTEHRFLLGTDESELVVPAARSWLAPARKAGASPRIVRRAQRANRAAIALEELDVGGRPALLAAFPRRTRARLNGAPAPRLALLRAGDTLLLPGGASLRLALWCSPRKGPPAPEQVGQACAVCRVAFTPESTVLACAVCGAVLHEDSVGAAGADRLDCASYAGSCPQCTRPLQTQEGWIDDVDD